MRININDQVKVKLTQEGFRIATEAGYQKKAQSVDQQDFSTFNLWELMSILGPHLFIGMPDTLIELNYVYIVDESVSISGPESSSCVLTAHFRTPSHNACSEAIRTALKAQGVNIEGLDHEIYELARAASGQDRKTEKKSRPTTLADYI